MNEVVTETLVSILLAVGAAVAAALKSFKFVEEGERGIKLRFGKAVRNKDGTPKEVFPGFCLLIPWVESLPRRHVLQQTINFPEQILMIKGGITFEVSAIVVFRVTNVYKALFEISNLESAIADICQGILRDVIQGKDLEELEHSRGISAEMLRELRAKSEEWGVEFIEFRLTHCAPTPESASVVNVTEAVKLRLKALGDAGLKLENINPVLAAVLIGAPYTAAITSSDFQPNQ